MKKVYIVFANKLFRDEELRVPLEYFKNMGIDLIKVSNKIEKALGKLGMEITPDIKICDISVENADGIILVGGPGTKIFFDDKILHNILNEFFRREKIIASICISPVVLAKAGLLNGKKATVWIDGKQILEQNNAIFIDKEVVVDGKIITANGPKAALKFSHTIYKMLMSN